VSVERRVLIGPEDRERTAVVLIPVPAAGEVEIDRTWRFVGWRDDVKLKVKREPERIDIVEPDE
jgi:hypothetical protein